MIGNVKLVIKGTSKLSMENGSLPTARHRTYRVS